MAGAAIAIDDAAATDTILSVKQRVFALNPKLFVRRQRLVYSAGPRGMDALADDETLGGAGVARDGTSELDVLVADLTEEEVAALGQEVCLLVFGSLMLMSYSRSNTSRACIHTTRIDSSFMDLVGTRSDACFSFVHIACSMCGCHQLCDAAKDGRSHDITKLLSDGANIEWQDRVRRVFDCVMRVS